MTVLRTPEDRFHNLPDYDFAAHYAQVGDTRLHYVDEGRGDESRAVPAWRADLVLSLSQDDPAAGRRASRA